MTEYEMASLFTQMSDNLGTQLTNFLTIASLYSAPDTWWRTV